jgi:hypothetical protein
MGLLGGGASMDKKNITDLVGLAVNNREGFKEISANWIQAAKDKKLGDAEIKRREDEVARKTKIIATVGEYYDYIKEESEGRKMKDEKKSEIMDLAEQKAMVDYEIDKATSQIRKDKLALKSQEIQKELDKLVYDGTDIATEEETAEEKKEAAPTTKKDTETKTQENAVQEQKTTEVPVQPKTESSTADTQGQPQPKPEGTTQQGKAQEQVQGEEVKQPVESFETAKGSVYTVLPDGKTQRFKTVTGEKNDPQDLIVFAKFKDAQQEQDFLSAQNRKNGQKLVVVDKDGNIYNTNEEIKGKDVKLAIIKDGNIIETAETSIDPKIGYNTFDQRRFEKDGEPVRSTHLGNKVTKINYKSPEPLQATISTEQGSTTTQGENVVPTQPQSAQTANVLADFEVTTTKGTAAPRTYTKNSNGKWIAQTKKEDGTLSKGVPVSSANIVAQLDSESSKRAADNASQDVEAKKAEPTFEQKVEATTKALEGVDKDPITKSISGIPLPPLEIGGYKRKPTEQYNINDPQSISEAYHKAKKDGSNPELVKAVEELIGKQEKQGTQSEVASTVSGEGKVDKALSSVESTAKALEGASKSNPTIWQQVKDFVKGTVKRVGDKLGIVSNEQHISNFEKAKAEWDKLSSREKKLKRADYELDDLHHSEGGYYKVGNSLIDLDLNSNHLKLLLENNKFLGVLNKLGVTKIHGENRPPEEMFAHYSDGKIHLNNNSNFENIRQVTNAMSHELGHHEWTKLTKEERDYVRTLPLETGMAKHYEAQEKSGKGKETSASLQEENFADYVMQYFQGKLYGDEALLNKIPTKLREMFDNKYSDLLKDNEHSEVAEAYHKSKADGSNPELVKAVESLLSKQEPAATKNPQPKEAESKLAATVKSQGGLEGFKAVLETQRQKFGEMMGKRNTVVQSQQNIPDKYKVVPITKGEFIIGYGIVDVDTPMLFEEEYNESDKGKAESRAKLMNTFNRQKVQKEQQTAAQTPTTKTENDKDRRNVEEQKPVQTDTPELPNNEGDTKAVPNQGNKTNDGAGIGRDNTKATETLEEAVQRVDSTSIIQLDDIIARAEKDLENAKTKTKKDDIQKTIDSLKKTRDQLSNTQAKSQTQTTKDENNIKSESETNKGEEGKMDTPLDKEQGKGREEGSTEEEVGEDEEAPSDKILGKKYARYIERALASPGISEEFKAALLEKAVPKVPISDEVTRSFAKAFVSELKTEKEMADAVEKLVNSFTAKINNPDKVTALATGVWEIEAIKQINKKLNDTFGEKTATDVFNRLSGIFSALGSALRLAGVADPATLAISNFGRHNTMEAHLFDAPTFEGSEVTHRQVAEDLIKIYDEAVQEQKDALKAKIAQDIKNQKIKDAAAPKAETKEATNEDAKSAKIDLVKRLNTKADEYLSRFRSRIEALTDYALYLYYKTAGSIVKTKRMFESKFGKDVTNTNWDKITSSDEFNNATQDIAREKLLAAINKSGQPNEYTGTETSNRTPAQMVIQSIVRHLTKKEKRPAAAKSIKEIIDGKTLDIATVSDLRRDIASGLLDLEEDARAEMLNQVDDLLATLVKDKADTTANPWLKKTYIRSQVRESLAALEKTIDDLIDDVTNKDLITDTISTEFITRTGMTAEEAAPYVKIIQDNIESFINEKVKARAEKKLLDSYGRNLITLKEAVDIQKNVFESSKAMLDKKKVELNAALRDKTIPTEKIKELQQEVKDLQARAMESKKKMEAYQKRLASGKKMLEMKAKSKTFNKQPSIERIGEIVRNGGLSEETIRQPFAEALGARVFTQRDAEKLRQLYERLDSAAFAIDKKEAYEEIARFAFHIKSDVDRKIFVDLFESYMYANMLGSPKTGDVALGAGSIIFLFQEATSLGIQIAKDIADIFTKGDLDFKNTRIMADAAKNSWVNSKMSGQGFWDIASGKEGLTLTDMAEGTQGRLVSSMNNLDTLRALRARALKEGNNAAAFGYKLGIVHQILSRSLTISDYIVSSTVLPYKLYRNLADQSRKELKEAGLFNPRYTEIIDKVQAKMKIDEVEQQLVTEGFAKSKNAGEYNHRRAQILYEFLEDSDKQSLIQAEDAVRRLTMTGRVAGYSGRVIGEINKGFNTVSNWGAKDEKKNMAAMILATASKLLLTPFTGMTFKVVQATKNYTPFGLVQPNRREGESGWQVFQDYNYYDVNKKTWDAVPASQHEREIRYASAIVPALYGLYVLGSAFDWEDEEVVINPDYEYLYTTGFSPAISKKLALQGITSEPYCRYKINPDGKIERIGQYRDYPFMWPLAVVGRIQEKLIFDQEEPMNTDPQQAPPPNDPLTGKEAFFCRNEICISI